MSEEQLSVCINLSSLLLLFVERRSLLAGGAAPFSFSFSAAFPLGGASIIISENPDAFGVLSALTFTGPENYFISFLVI